MDQVHGESDPPADKKAAEAHLTDHRQHSLPDRQRRQVLALHVRLHRIERHDGQRGSDGHQAGPGHQVSRWDPLCLRDVEKGAQFSLHETVGRQEADPRDALASEKGQVAPEQCPEQAVPASSALLVESPKPLSRTALVHRQATIGCHEVDFEALKRAQDHALYRRNRDAGQSFLDLLVGDLQSSFIEVRSPDHQWVPVDIL